MHIMNRKNKNGRQNKQKKFKLNSWICNNIQVVNSPLKNYHVNIKDHIAVEMVKKQKIIIQMIINEPYNYLIKPP